MNRAGKTLMLVAGQQRKWARDAWATLCQLAARHVALRRAIHNTDITSPGCRRGSDCTARTLKHLVVHTAFARDDDVEFVLAILESLGL